MSGIASRVKFDRGLPFGMNVQTLETATGEKCEKTKTRRAHLTKPGGSTREIKAEQGSFKSVAFLTWLAHGRSEFVISREEHEIVRDFFSDLWDQPGHDTVAFLREPGVKVQIFRYVT